MELNCKRSGQSLKTIEDMSSTATEGQYLTVTGH